MKNDSEVLNTQSNLAQYLQHLIELSMSGEGDSDRHVITLLSIALACKGKTFVELGVRSGTTTLPLLLAAHLNEGKLISVDVENTIFECPEQYSANWEFIKKDSIDFLSQWDETKKMDFVYIDDWHSYKHVKKELELIDKYIGPSSIVILHDLMYGNHEPFYHCDLASKSGQWAEGGPYRAVAELDPNFWEWATLPWNNGITILRKKYSSKYHPR